MGLLGRAVFCGFFFFLAAARANAPGCVWHRAEPVLPRHCLACFADGRTLGVKCLVREPDVVVTWWVEGGLRHVERPRALVRADHAQFTHQVGHVARRGLAVLR